MKLLLDTCVWGKAKTELSLAGHDVIWGGDWESDPGDAEILSMARSDGRVLITLDKDFGELAVVRRIPHCGILRLVNIPARSQAKFCLKILAKYGGDLEDGAIITSDGERVRIRGREA
jgi:predicted nuclease of predicted toxin-antitoxin system